MSSQHVKAAVDGVILSLTNPRSEIAKGAEQLAALLDSKHGRARIVARSARPPEGDLEPAGVGEGT